MKNIRIFYLKIFNFLVVKFSIYLNRHVFVMGTCYTEAPYIAPSGNILPSSFISSVFSTSLLVPVSARSSTDSVSGSVKQSRHSNNGM